MATELSSGAITNILEAVPGIATVLRSPVADAIVNLSRAAAGLIPFNKKDSSELIRYAVRRGLIRSDEADRVTAEIDGAPKRPGPPPLPPPKPVVQKPAPQPANRSPFHRKPDHVKARVVVHKPAARKPAVKKPAAKRAPTRKAAPKKAAPKKAAPKKVAGKAKKK
jgi:hypothetical protein